MKLVDIKGNINPKQRLILVITILLFLVVIFYTLKIVTKKQEGIEYKNTSIDKLIVFSTETTDRDTYWNLNSIVYDFVITYQSDFNEQVKNIEYYYNALDPNYKKYLGKKKYTEISNNFISKVIDEEKNQSSSVQEPLIKTVYKMDEYDNAYICELITKNNNEDAYIGIILDTKNKNYNIFYIN